MISELDEEIELVNRHVRIFELICNREPIGIVKLSEVTGYPKHKVRYSLRVLEEEGLVEPTPQGATRTEKTPEFLSSQCDQLDDLVDRLESLRTTIGEQATSA